MPEVISCALVAWITATASHVALAQADGTSTVPRDRALASPTLTYGNPAAPIMIELADTVRRGAATYAHITLRALVDRFPGLVALRWTIASRGSIDDDRAASALLEAAAQGAAWCLIEAIGTAPTFGDHSGDQLDAGALLAAAQACSLELPAFKHAMTERTYSAVAARPTAESRGATQRLTINGEPVTRSLVTDVGERVERLALRRGLAPPSASQRLPLIGRSRGSYERPALNATSVPAASPASATGGEAPFGGFVLIAHAQPRWSVDVYCVLDTVCQGLLGELERLAAATPRAGAIRARWTPLAAATQVNTAIDASAQPSGAAPPADSPPSTDATLALTCAAQRGTSPPLLLQLAASGGSNVAACADASAAQRALATTLAYTARAHRAGLRHDLAVVINGRVLAGGVTPSGLRGLLVDDTSNGLLERLPPWLR
ncbi:MAG: hypothetical protein IPL79_00655 [Myxococcales bacterium]|nr:hypothetical protein [Myxococcales bacterium]